MTMVNHSRRWAAMAFLAASAAGATAAAQQVPQGAGGLSVFMGNYALNSSTTVTVSTPISQTESRNTHERLVVQGGTASELDFVVSNDAGDRCVLHANRSAPGAVTFPAGQPCAMTDTERNLRLALTLRSGTGTLQNDVMLMDFSWEVSVDAGFMTVHGLAAQRSSGRRDNNTATPAPTPAAAPPSAGPAISAPSIATAPLPQSPQPGLTGSPWITTGMPGAFGGGMPAQPFGQPAQPFGQPYGQPFGQPAVQPIQQPIAQPTPQPIQQPSGQPFGQPAVWGAPQPTAWGTPPQPITQPTVWGAPGPTPSWGAPSWNANTTPTNTPTINTPASAWGAPSGALSPSGPSITFGSLSGPTVLPAPARHPTRPRVTRVAPIDVPHR